MSSGGPTLDAAAMHRVLTGMTDGGRSLGDVHDVRSLAALNASYLHTLAARHGHQHQHPQQQQPYQQQQQQQQLMWQQQMLTPDQAVRLAAIRHHKHQLARTAANSTPTLPQAHEDALRQQYVQQERMQANHRRLQLAAMTQQRHAHVPVVMSMASRM
jgi:hypothetical protein